MGDYFTPNIQGIIWIVSPVMGDCFTQSMFSAFCTFHGVNIFHNSWGKYFSQFTVQGVSSNLNGHPPQCMQRVAHQIWAAALIDLSALYRRYRECKTWFPTYAAEFMWGENGCTFNWSCCLADWGFCRGTEAPCCLDSSTIRCSSNFSAKDNT